MMKHPIIRGLETLQMRVAHDWRWQWSPEQQKDRAVDAWWRRLCVRIPDADRTAVGQYKEDV